MGFLHPLALLALPLSLLPLWLEWRGLRTGRPIRFSSLYLLERARRTHVPRLPTRSRWVALLRAAAIALLVTAAARPLGCGSGDPASHRPTRAIVAVDVSASAGQVADGVTAWSRIRAAGRLHPGGGLAGGPGRPGGRGRRDRRLVGSRRHQRCARASPSSSPETGRATGRARSPPWTPGSMKIRRRTF